MKKKNLLILILCAVLSLSIAVFFLICYVPKEKIVIKTGGKTKTIYYCPMHPDFVSEKSGNCLVCGMSLIKKVFSGPQKTAPAKKGELLFYRNPMNPQVTSDVPMKDSMGMDYVPVYEAEAKNETAGIYISPEKQQLIGVTKEKITKRKLTHEIFTVGKVAYDPELYVAQEEYIQALKTEEATKDSTLASVSEQSNSLVSASEKKLLLLGMSKEQIEELGREGIAQENLYLSNSADSVWVYMTIYEYEAGLIKEGMPVEIETVAFPGEAFIGKVLAVKPVLNPETRSLQVRTEIANPEHKLKPEMFANAKIKVELGEKLAVPETAVLDTGLRKIVYLAQEGDTLAEREVILGQKAQGYYEVLGGLKEGDIVITSGNFLIDSESKLKGATSSGQ